MIKLSDAELISLLPSFFKENTDMQALSYAIKKGMEKMLAYSALSALYANIDGLPNEIIDLLALEFKSQYYDESMDIDIKRDIIKNSIAWYAKGGSVSAVDEMIQTVLGEGEVVEWFKYNGKPGTFYIKTSTELSPDAIKRFNEIINKVKNIRSHLTSVEINREIKNTCYAAVFNCCIPHIIVK